jgi:hypothetical protein
MDLLLYWLPISGGLLLGSFSHALSIGNQKAAAWFAGLGAACFVILFVLQVGQAIFREGPQAVETHSVDAPVVTIDRFVFETIPKSGDFPGAVERRPVIKNSGRTP